jgi:hypothetical protein
MANIFTGFFLESLLDFNLDKNINRYMVRKIKNKVA